MEPSDKVVETVVVGSYVEMETEGKPKTMKTQLSKFLWHGGSVYDAWFSCASNQVSHFLPLIEKKKKSYTVCCFFSPLSYMKNQKRREDVRFRKRSCVCLLYT